MRYRKKGRGWQPGRIFLTFPVSALCTLLAVSSLIFAKSSPSVTPPPLINDTSPINNSSSFNSTSLPTPTNTPSVCDQRLKPADKTVCEQFIKNYPAEYTTTYLSDDQDVIIHNKDYQIYYLSSSTYYLSYPIVVKDSSHIAIFSLPDSNGNTTELALAPQTSGKKQPGLKNYYNKEVIGDIDNCQNCLVSGFFISPEIGSSNKSLKRAFEIAGKNTQITFYNLHLGDQIPSGYFNAQNIKHIAIEHLWFSGKNSEKTLRSPAIKIKDCNSIKLRDIRLTDLEIMPYKSDMGIIAIINPVKFQIDRTVIALKDSRTNNVAGIYILFDGKNDFKKYRPGEQDKAKKVHGKIRSSKIYKVAGEWDPDWKGVVLTAQSKDWRARYNLIHGRIIIHNTSLPDKWGRASKDNLPNIRIDYWTDPKIASIGQPTTLATLITQARFDTTKPVVKNSPTITDFAGGADNPATSPDSSKMTTGMLTTTKNESRIDNLKATKRVSNSGETRMASGTVLSLLIPFLAAIFK